VSTERIDPRVSVVCDFAGHEYADAGGGLEICVECQAERWVAPDEFTGAGCCPKEDDYLRAQAMARQVGSP
jgi:hypothetical protein